MDEIKSFGIKKRKFIRKNKCKKYSGLCDIKLNTFVHKKFRNMLRCEIRNVIINYKDNFDIIDYQVPNVYKDVSKTYWDTGPVSKTKCYSNNKY